MEQKNKKRLWYLVLGILLLSYLVLFTGLWRLWYDSNQFVGFHWFDDSLEWLQQDKIGHFYTAFHIAVFVIKIAEAFGLKVKYCYMFGATTGFLFQTPIELLDGFQQAWGASIYDIMANALGALSAIAFIHFKQPMLGFLKFSFMPSFWSAFRPDLLGNSFFTSMMKDYNGQTYWAIFDISTISGLKWWPNWLNLAVGHSAEGLIGGHDNIFEVNGKQSDFSRFTRSRQIVFSLDINVLYKGKNKFLNVLLYPFNIVKLPLPALEINLHGGIKWHWCYF